MPKYESKDIRNLVLIGHGASGKTTLAERILFKTKVTNRMGSVMEKSSLFDADPDEKERQHSITSGLAFASWKGSELNLIDTPGSPDFVSDALNSLIATDLVLLSVDGTAGVKVNTRRMWAAAEAANLPTIVTVTRLDGEHADFEKTLIQIQEVFGSQCLPILLPKGRATNLEGVKAVLGNGDDDAARGAAEKLTEAVVETDDDLMSRYLEGEELTSEEITNALRSAIASRAIVPVVPVSAEKDVGVAELLDAIGELGPSPLVTKALTTAAEAEADADGEPIDPNSPFIGVTFKSNWTKFGRVSFVRILAGGLKAGDSIQNHSNEKVEKLGHIYRPAGKELKEVETATAGDIIVLQKVDSVAIGDTLTTPGSPKLKVCMPKLPLPMVALSVEPKTRGDEQKISGALQRLADEDLCFTITRDSQTREMVVTGMSNLHLEVTLARLKANSGVEVNTDLPKIPYRETIAGSAEAKYRHKKQSGGSGEFAEVWLRVKPVERGSGFSFVNKTVGGSIPGPFIPSVEKGVRGTMADGILAGCVVVDVEVEVYDGKHHPVDSKDIAFQKAGRHAFKAAFMDAKPTLLEPIVTAEISVPNDQMGTIMSDLNSRRARIQNTETQGDESLVTAHAPLAEIQSYSADLRSMTAGEGSYLVEFSHYDVVPQHAAQQVIANYKTKESED